MAHCILAGSFQNYHLVLNTLTVKLQFEFEASIQCDLSLRIVKFPKLHERSSRTIIFDEKQHVTSLPAQWMQAPRGCE